MNEHKRITYNKFVALLSSHGDRTVAEHIVRGCVARIKIKEEKDSLSFFARGARPLIVGVQKPIKLKKPKIVPIPSNRGRRLAIQRIIQGAQRGGRGEMAHRMYQELSSKL
jgi:ribosomal protein S7